MPLRSCFIGAMLIAHVAVRAIAPRAEQTLLPMAAMLAAFGLVFVMRLEPDLAAKQLLWNGLGMVVLDVALPLLADDRQAAELQVSGRGARARTDAGHGGGGKEINGSRLWLGAGGFYFQVTEAMKVLLVVFLAGYLADRRLLLSAAGGAGAVSTCPRCRTCCRWA